MIMMFLSLVLNGLDNKGRSIILIPLCIVAWIVFWAFSGVVPHLLAKTISSTDGFLTVPISTMLIWIWIQVQSQDCHYSKHQWHHKQVSMRLQWQILVALLLWKGYWSGLIDKAYKFLPLNNHLLMDPKVAPLKWDESLEYHHAHNLCRLGYKHQRCLQWVGSIKGVDWLYSMSSLTWILGYELGDLTDLYTIQMMLHGA